MKIAQTTISGSVRHRGDENDITIFNNESDTVVLEKLKVLLNKSKEEHSLIDGSLIFITCSEKADGNRIINSNCQRKMLCFYENVKKTPPISGVNCSSLQRVIDELDPPPNNSKSLKLNR